MKAAALEVLVDVLGLSGFGLVCAGVYQLAGIGWTCIAAGGPLTVAYVWRELGCPRPRGRGKSRG